jgi:Icc-related predicted phosphoesterase
MKIMFLSDTHGRHREITELYGELPYVDIMIHSGDCTRYGEFEETDLFMNWFTTQNAKHKVLIAGNHDFVFQNKERTKQLLELNPSITYLQDEFVNIDGIGIYGSPWSPVFGMWAFMKHRNAELDEVWQKVPTDGSVDISVRGNYNVGCEMLANRINDIHPKVHVFGHIHECGGMIKDETEVPVKGMVSLNASLLNIRYVLANPIWIWDTETNDWSSIEIKE